MSKVRLAIINKDRCKPTKCQHECRKICPENRQGKECITISQQRGSTATISETFCIGCNMCVKVCPFMAIQIVNLPVELTTEIVHRYDENGFRLYRLPLLSRGQVTGIMGSNGIGKSTILQILAGSIIPNFENGLSKEAVVKYFRGTSLQEYFSKLYAGTLRVSRKPQILDQLSQTIDEYFFPLNLPDLLKSMTGRTMNTLSGGELQQAVVYKTLMADADVYIFDEPTNFLDVKGRLMVAQEIQKLSQRDDRPYVILVEHDLAILEACSDVVSLMYGVPSAYGVVSLPHSTANAINMFFRGYIPSENMRIRPEPYSYKLGIQVSYETNLVSADTVPYPETYISYSVDGDRPFILTVKAGSFQKESSLTVILGRNGVGKSSFLYRLKAILSEQGLTVSHKPQHPTITHTNTYPTVQAFVQRNMFRKHMSDPVFQTDVLRPMNIDSFQDKKINVLSGGELQRFMTLCCLATEAHVYLLDEPSANLDIEQRAIITRILKRFAMHFKKAVFVIEHDILMATSLASEIFSQILVFTGDHEKRIFQAEKPNTFAESMNIFFRNLDVTLRTDKTNGRPRINKFGSVLDQEQKKKGRYI